MTKTSAEKKQHEEKVMKIANELASEYGAWNGWTTGIGRYVALGEYILGLEAEIARAKATIAAKKSVRAGAEGLFKR